MAHVCKIFGGESHCLHWMVFRLLSSYGVIESTSLDLDPLACGDLGVGTHTYGGMLEPILMGSSVSWYFWVLNPHIWCVDDPWTLYGHWNVVSL